MVDCQTPGDSRYSVCMCVCVCVWGGGVATNTKKSRPKCIVADIKRRLEHTEIKWRFHAQSTIRLSDDLTHKNYTIISKIDPKNIEVVEK